MAAAVESAPYTGPSPRHMIDTHTLAQEIINRNNDPCPILDEDELKLLSEFVANPSRASSILEARGQAADPAKSGSLVAYVISLHDADKPALTESEIAVLKGWFENGQK
ncbi:hypothetical protein CMUS01_06209 [Colletotrichum musicola]|uniref:Uncharacterized protein n=1 Tax=Colletotrichum musicola TaxID=2175873 RepID=A0A8H6NIY0_9PEZI|nr:hypothetical protein CMUS01_06209 [Colletotrichum musicola]